MHAITKRLALVLAAFLLCPVPDGGAAEPARPNVLVIVVDDMNDWTGFAGGQGVTPNLDRLAARGLVFPSMQAPATFCTPSRTAFLTGVHPATSGHYRNQPALFGMPEIATLPAHFASAGYKVLGAGKVFHHMRGYLDRRGYAEYYAWNPANKEKGWPLLPWVPPAPTPKRPASAIPTYTGTPEFDFAALDDAVEDRMADSIDAKWAAEQVGRAHDRPFMMTIGFYAPHKPNYVPKKYFDLYPLEKIKPPHVPVNDLDDLPGDPHVKPLCCVSPVKSPLNSGAWPIHKEIVDHGDWRVAIQGYLAAMSYADAQIGRVLDALNAGPNRDNTIVVFLSDNGYHLGEKEKWAKHSLWQRTTGVPFIMAGPGIRVGRYDGVASLLDIYPTLLSLAHVTAPAHPLDGQDLVPVLSNPAKPMDRQVLIAGNEGEFAVVTDRWRYIRYLDGGEELYDRHADPNEWVNLAGDPARRKLMDGLARLIPANPAKSKPDVELGQVKLVVDGQDFHWEAVQEGEIRASDTSD